ncbi:E3 ubiquitin-protein ligase RNF4-like isoform X1 [Onthophagus taurus]|uniref:E3 ubiquitin-protein ligase RNF4-like isoform X1 n=1 Tax=Onthophagus taurus TaxID=166361 RepID=UPI0039BDAF4C
MPRKRTRRCKVIVNYRISDDDEDDNSPKRRKVAKPQIQEQQKRNKEIKYYISSDSEEEPQNSVTVVETDDTKNIESDNVDLITEVQQLAAKSAAICEELMKRSKQYTNEVTTSNEEQMNFQTAGVVDLTNVLETKHVDNKGLKNNNLESQDVVDLSDSPKIQECEGSNNQHKQNVRTGLECPICMEDLTGRQPKVTPCGHYFCKNCVQHFGSKSFNCPTCRKKCYVKRLYSIYL